MAAFGEQRIVQVETLLAQVSVAVSGAAREVQQVAIQVGGIIGGQAALVSAVSELRAEQGRSREALSKEAKELREAFTASLKEMRDEFKEDFVPRERYEPVERVVFGLVGTMLFAIVTALLAYALQKP